MSLIVFFPVTSVRVGLALTWCAVGVIGRQWDDFLIGAVNASVNLLVTMKSTKMPREFFFLKLFTGEMFYIDPELLDC